VQNCVQISLIVVNKIVQVSHLCKRSFTRNHEALLCRAIPKTTKAFATVCRKALATLGFLPVAQLQRGSKPRAVVAVPIQRRLAQVALGLVAGSLRLAPCLNPHHRMHGACLRRQFRHHHRVLSPGVSSLSLRKTTLRVRTLLRPPSSQTKSQKLWNQ